MYKPIRDYAIIGNLRSAALVAKNGSIDWAPAPFIDSPTVFAVLLDDKKGGYWRIMPIGEFESTQEYIPNTNILVTKFKTKDGTAELFDCIPIEKEQLYLPKESEAIFEIHRKIVCKTGSCEFKIEFDPRPNYARGMTKLFLASKGVRFGNGAQKGIVISNADYTIKGNLATARVNLKAGEKHYLTLLSSTADIPQHDDSHYETVMERTKTFWEEWVHRCDLEKCPMAGPWHDMAVRSSLVLKILFFEPPGTIAAAPTTSLPEEIGGVRNWDYRFTWIRDSAFVFQALFSLGYVQEAEEYVKWLVERCCGMTKDRPGDLQIMYGLRGQRDLKEEFLSHLEGYRGSRPVRIGNDAYLQKQWDIYGSVLDTVWRIHLLKKEHVIDLDTWETLRSFANYIVKIWREPDEGLWEVRGGKKHFVYSKVMCWVALDRALKLADAHQFEGEKDIWQREKDTIYKEVMNKGWSRKKKSFVQSFDSDELDASLLLMPVVGFINGQDPKMLSTIKQIDKELSRGEGLLLRYASKDGLPGKEGVFLLASFWLVDALVFAGEKERAQELFEKIAKLANHIGLFSEEMNPETKEFLGNFPQAYTHIGLINSAFYLASNK